MNDTIALDGVPDSLAVQAELNHRVLLWQTLLEQADPALVPAKIWHSLEIYNAAQGIFQDAARTRAVSGNRWGVTLSLLHTGKSYPDELSNEALVYHYPSTKRRGDRDQAEVEATKNVRRLGLFLFVILRQEFVDGVLRDLPHGFGRVRIGYVERWNDDAQRFLIVFNDGAQIPLAPLADEQPFELAHDRERKLHQTTARPNAQRFQLDVFDRYGAKCAVCDLSIPRLVQAAHLIAWSKKGPDDARNGLPLCGTHHLALDARLFAVEPGTYRLKARYGITAEDLRITRQDIRHLKRLPHDHALRRAWDDFER
jgi:putative restriction endonuclease